MRHEIVDRLDVTVADGGGYELGRLGLGLGSALARLCVAEREFLPAFGGARAKAGVVKLVPGGKAAYKAAQKTGGKVGGYAKYTANESRKNARNVSGVGARAFGQFAKSPNQSFKKGMNTFNKGLKMATTPRKMLSKAAKTTKKTGKKVLKEMKKLFFVC